jgi:hypothetical protein
MYALPTKAATALIAFVGNSALTQLEVNLLSMRVTVADHDERQNYGFQYADGMSFLPEAKPD